VKIVYVVPSLGISGGIKVVVEHAEGLLARGHDVSIVTLDARHAWIPIHVPVVEVPDLSRATLPEADVHVATWFPTVVPTARAGRARRVFHFSQGYEALYDFVAHRREEIDEAYREPIPKLLISAHLLALFEGVFPGPFHVLPQAIRVEHYRPPEPLRAARKQPAAVGVVGPFEAANKGIPFALEAVRRLRAEGRDVLLHRASQMQPSDAERRQMQADVYGEALPMDVMPIWYHACDILLHPSFEAEGFPLPPLEAMASGIPVVLTDIPSYGPIPRDAAAFVPPGDAAALAAEAARLLDDGALWRERRRRGLEVAGQFTLGPVLDRLEEIFAQKTS
jgi:glycosyltransferase involved in cell wall biosynthesis